MRVGDEDALKAFDDMALASPGAEEMLKDRYLSPIPDLAYLAGLPDGTLGKKFEC
jgi:ubiquinone biosynthesis protein Coq4